jgi:hypothetical protein
MDDRSCIHRVFALLLLLLSLPAVPAAEPDLSRQIDQRIQERLDRAKIPASPLADDAVFVRRVYLDLIGRIPTYEQTTAFLARKEPDRRARLIDELLSRPEYGLHFATIWRDLIVDRREENAQARNSFSWEFVDWLASGFNKDRGWNAIVAELLTAEGEAKQNPATLLLLANRMNNFPRPADLASTTGRLFLGIQLRCAQCHDHPYVAQWRHDDFWGVAAFFGQVRDHAQQPDGVSPKPAFYDRPQPDAKKETGYINRLKRAGLLPPPAGAQIAIPEGADPTKTARVVPARFFLAAQPELKAEGPYRTALAAWLTAPENPYFARVSANRLWAHFFGRGLVNPLDDFRPEQPASHPELLDLLEKEFKAAGFQPKHLIRAICNSQAYQRTSRPLPGNAQDHELFSHMAIRLLSPDQAIDAFAIAAGRMPTVGKNREQQTAPFVTGEADADPTEFSHGIPQFLMLLNGGNTNAVPPLLGKLTNGKSKEEAVRALYLVVLSRPPHEAEQRRMLAYLERGTSGSQGYRDIYWVLINSAEFILNH